jgi:hypothetical protein
VLKSQKNSRTYFQFEIFTRFPELTAVVTTRSCGDMRGDMRLDDRQRVAADWQVDPDNLVLAHQVHGKRVTRAELALKSPDGSKTINSTDGLMTDQAQLGLMILTADCAPIFIYHPHQRVICLLHAGWRGAQAGIIAQAIDQMAQLYRAQPDQLVVGIGPMLGPADYQVRSDLVDSFAESHGQKSVEFFHHQQGQIFFDLAKVLVNDLTTAGISLDQIELSGISTAQDLDNFYSHRAERGNAGRFGSLMMLSR